MYHAGLTVKREGAGDSKAGIQVINLPEVQAALQTVRDENSNTHWALITYTDANFDSIKLAATGSDISKLSSHLNDTNAGYAIVQIEDLVDGKVKTYRYAYVNWIGENVPGVKKAKIGTYKTFVTKTLGHYNVEIFAETQGEVTEDVIRDKVLMTSGTKSSVRSDVSGPQYVQPQVKQTKYEAPEYTKKQALNIINEGLIKQQIAEIRNDASSLNWMLIGYKDRETLQPHASGNGDITELAESLSPSAVNYGFLRTTDKVDNSTTVKFFFINWVGDAVPPLFKGRITSHKGTVEEIFEPYHIKLSGVEADDMTPAKVAEKLLELKGSRK